MFLERNRVTNKDLFDFDTDLYDYKAWTPQLSLGYQPDVITSGILSRFQGKKEKKKKREGQESGWGIKEKSERVLGGSQKGMYP